MNINVNYIPPRELEIDDLFELDIEIKEEPKGNELRTYHHELRFLYP